MTASHMAASSASIVLLLFERCAPRCLARPAAGRFAGTTCDELGAISGLCFATGLATGLAVSVRVRVRVRVGVRAGVRVWVGVRVSPSANRTPHLTLTLALTLPRGAQAAARRGRR